jgi:subtilisin family serine protease
MKDNAYDENGILKEQGAIFSTLVIDGVAGYGYYEGTSMACPHVSGIAALGLAYAKQQHRHFTSEEFRELMYSTARDIEEYFVGEKLYYMRHESAGATPIKMNLADYRGKMGRLSDAGALLKAIDGSGRDMRIPNICLAPGATTTLNLADYITESATSVEVVNEAIATATLESNTLTISAKSEGQTSLTLTTDKGTKHHATITVREGASNGWL